MIVSLIAAMAKHRVIGKDNQMPWHLPADLIHFKVVTMGKPIIMGRKTYESIGRALPGRRNIVLTRQDDFSLPDCDVVSSLESALSLCAGEEEVMIIGGGQLFTAALAIAQRMYLTFIELDVEGDSVFPEWDESEWRVVQQEQHQPDENNVYPYRFIDYERRQYLRKLASN